MKAFKEYIGFFIAVIISILAFLVPFYLEYLIINWVTSDMINEDLKLIVNIVLYLFTFGITFYLSLIFGTLVFIKIAQFVDKIFKL